MMSGGLWASAGRASGAISGNIRLLQSSGRCGLVISQSINIGSPASLLRSPVNNTRGQVRCLLISRRRCGQDDKIRDDPDVRNILGSIKKDFEQKQDGNKEPAPEEAKGSAPAEGKARDLGALLEEIYGGEGGGGGQGSVGGYLDYRDEDATVILDVEEEREAAR